MSETATLAAPRSKSTSKRRRQYDAAAGPADDTPSPAAAAPVRLNPAKLVLEVKSILVEITGLKAETVSRFEKTEEGYEIDVDMVEMKTLQGSSDILATYQVLLDKTGELIDYRRVRRYGRNELSDG